MYDRRHVRLRQRQFVQSPLERCPHVGLLVAVRVEVEQSRAGFNAIGARQRPSQEPPSVLAALENIAHSQQRDRARPGETLDAVEQPPGRATDPSGARAPSQEVEITSEILRLRAAFIHDRRDPWLIRGDLADAGLQIPMNDKPLLQKGNVERARRRAAQKQARERR